MNLKTTALAAAVAAATWCMAPFASAQMQETTPPTAAHPTDPATDPSMRQPTTPPPEQAAPADPATPSQGAATTPVDQKKVEQFADAYVQVQTIQQKANADLQTTTDPAQADQVKSNAQSEMIAAVERSGLQVEEFNQIVASMAADNELRSRVSAEVQKRMGGGTAAPQQ